MSVCIPIRSDPPLTTRIEGFCSICIDENDNYITLYRGEKWEVVTAKDTSAFLVGNCGHAIHKLCYRDTMKICPLCRKVDWLGKPKMDRKTALATVTVIIGALFISYVVISRLIN